jgi:hypothetical protein
LGFVFEVAPSVSHHLASLISNPTLRSNATVSSSVSVRPSFSCSLIRWASSGFERHPIGTLAIVTLPFSPSICPTDKPSLVARLAFDPALIAFAFLNERLHY